MENRKRGKVKMSEAVNYSDMEPAEVRKLIREGKITCPTSGMCAGYAQANLVILPKKYADDFKEFARKNRNRAQSWKS